MAASSTAAASQTTAAAWRADPAVGVDSRYRRAVKDKHIRIRVEQCLALANASNCPRRKFGALLLDPERNVILMDGYNGGPRGGGELCGASCIIYDDASCENVCAWAPVTRRGSRGRAPRAPRPGPGS